MVWSSNLYDVDGISGLHGALFCTRFCLSPIWHAYKLPVPKQTVAIDGVAFILIFKISITVLAICMISIITHDAFATPPSLPPGSIRMEISELPVLGQEFTLTIFATPDGYDDSWIQASDEKKWPAKFTLILPKGFEIIDDDFSEGRPYYGMHGVVLDDYLFYSAVRDVGLITASISHAINLSDHLASMMAGLLALPDSDMLTIARSC